MSDSLAIWMYGIRVATIEKKRGQKMYLRYTQEARDNYDPGLPLLSQRFPLTAARYPNNAVKSFLDGLLPEEEQRRLIAKDRDVKDSDTYALIAAVGRDCAGALVFLPEGDSLESADSSRSDVPLTDTELSSLVARLRDSPLGISDEVRLSLAGAQEKLVLVRTVKGVWARPGASSPSTHILKPDNVQYPGIVENEAFCMRLAKNLEIPVANVSIEQVDARKLVVIERFDRTRASDGRIERIHQEDLCQALGFPPTKKYEQDGGPSFKKIARFLDDAVGRGSLDTLARLLVLNVLVGNCDAHAKNISILYEDPGQASLAPAYDLLSSEIYGERKLAMYIDSVQQVQDVTAKRIINEIASWGVSIPHAEDLLRELLNASTKAVARTARETVGVPEDLPRLIERRLDALQTSA